MWDNYIIFFFYFFSISPLKDNDNLHSVCVLPLAFFLILFTGLRIFYFTLLCGALFVWFLYYSPFGVLSFFEFAFSLLYNNETVADRRRRITKQRSYYKSDTSEEGGVCVELLAVKAKTIRNIFFSLKNGEGFNNMAECGISSTRGFCINVWEEKQKKKKCDSQRLSSFRRKMRRCLANRIRKVCDRKWLGIEKKKWNF